jgi:hypothetical protein
MERDMAKSVWTVVVSWSAAAAIVLSTAAPDAAAAVRYGGGFLHGGMRSGDGFGDFRPGLGSGYQRSFFPGVQRSETGCGFAPSRCSEGTHQGPPHRVGYWPGPHWGGPWGGFGPVPYGGGAGPDAPPDDPGGPDAAPPVVASAQASGVQGELAGGELLVREFSEAAKLALGRCRTVSWPADGAPLDEADAKRLSCVGDVLTVYADKLETIATILPERLRSIPAVLRATAKKVRAAKTKSEAASAIATATAAVHKVIALLKADDPMLRSTATRESGQITQTLALADEKLEKAVGL